MEDLLWKLGFETYLVGLVAGTIYMNLLVSKVKVGHNEIRIIEVIKVLAISSIFSLLAVTLFFKIFGSELMLRSSLETNKIFTIGMSIVCLINSFFFFGFIKLKIHKIDPFPFNKTLIATVKWWSKLILSPLFLWVLINVMLLSEWLYASNWSLICSSIGVFAAIIFNGFNELNYKT